MEEYTVEKLLKLKHLSEFTLGEIYTNLGLYQPIVIDTYDFITQPIEENPPDSPPWCGEQYFTGADVNTLLLLQQSQKTFMMPCKECQKEQAFKMTSNPIHIFDKSRTTTIQTDGKNISAARLYTFAYGYSEDDDFDFQDYCKNVILCQPHFHIEYTCPYESNHKIYGEFIIEEISIKTPDDIIKSKKAETIHEYDSNLEKVKGYVILKKVGQYPSTSDIQSIHSQKYNNILKNHFKINPMDYNRALKTFSLGFGCASFLYLRRILEKIAEKFHSECKCKCQTFDEEKYAKSRFNDKVKMLEKAGKIIFPKQLENVRSELYSVLSNGVHETPDEKCQELFPYVKFAIDTILNAKIYELENDKALKEMNKVINKAAKKSN